MFSKRSDGERTLGCALAGGTVFVRFRGAFGVVHRCIEKATGKTYAVKFIPTLTPEDKATVRREIDVMADLNHAKLLNLHDAFEEDVEMAMVTEFVAGGELFDRIADPNYKMTEAEAIKYMRQICQGLQHMHENNIAHLDLKVRVSLGVRTMMYDFGVRCSLRISSARPRRVPM